MEKFLPYGKQSILQEDIREVAECLRSDVITRGPKVEEFEKAVADFCGAEHAVAFSNGTAALMATCFAADMGPYDRFITTPNTFVATVGAGLLRGATPVFVDIDRDSGNLNLQQVEDSLEYSSTRGKTVVLPVHFAGIAVDVPRLDRLIQDPRTVIIEDAAHALGSCYPDGSRVGCCSHSAMAIFSFHPVKHITTGEGGMVTTNDAELCHRLRLYRNNGMEREPSRMEGEAAPWYYEVQSITGNYNFTEFQAALGLSQMKRLDVNIAKRRDLVADYRELLQGVPQIRLFSDAYDAATAYHIFVVQIDFEAYETTRAEVMRGLKEKGIGTQVHYIPVYRHPFFKNINGDISEYFPNMEEYYAQALTLPLFVDMEKEDVERVVRELKALL